LLAYLQDIATVDPTSLFHPAVADWFDNSFAAATAAQAEAWPAIQAGEHTLIAAPTGSGKTLAAFLAAIDGLRLAAQGVVERHQAQPRGSARRDPRGLA
jgi:Lhr-like helicase